MQGELLDNGISLVWKSLVWLEANPHNLEVNGGISVEEVNRRKYIH